MLFWLHYRHSKVYFICVLQIPSCQRKKANKKKTIFFIISLLQCLVWEWAKEAFLMTYFPVPNKRRWLSLGELFPRINSENKISASHGFGFLVLLVGGFFCCLFVLAAVNNWTVIMKLSKKPILCQQRHGSNETNASERRNSSVWERSVLCLGKPLICF